VGVGEREFGIGGGFRTGGGEGEPEKNVTIDSPSRWAEVSMMQSCASTALLCLPDLQFSKYARSALTLPHTIAGERRQGQR